MTPINVLHSGQSLSMGRNTGGPNLSRVSPLVTAWNTGQEWGSVGSQWVTPQNGARPYGPGGENNSGAWLCHHIAQRTGRPVRHVLSGKGAQGLNNWVGSSRPGWNHIVGTVAAIEAAGHAVRPFDVFYWQGSESNSDHTVSQYRPWWDEFMSNLFAGGYLGPQTAIIISGIMKSSAAHIDAEHQAIAAADPQIGYARKFASMTTSDGVHLTGMGSATMGASAFCTWADMN